MAAEAARCRLLTGRLRYHHAAPAPAATRIQGLMAATFRGADGQPVAGVAVDRAQRLAVLGQEECPKQQGQHGGGHVVGVLAGSSEAVDPGQLGRGEPGLVLVPDGDDADQRQVLQQPHAQEVVASDRPGRGPVSAVLDHLVVDVPGAEQADAAGVRGADQNGPLPCAAGAPDVVA
jgi:hypothetical protein